ncbi:MAG: MotA/TolQ/ExbB proton channel family protein [Brevinematia bacterium]
MFGAKNLIEFLKIGGISMYFLVLCSVIALGVFIERMIFYYKKSRLKREELVSKFKEALSEKRIDEFKGFFKANPSPFARVLLTGLENMKSGKEEISTILEKKIIEEEEELEKYTSIMGSISNISVYLGLLGTVLGIIKAFESIAVTGSSSVTVVIKGVAEALTTTAVGLMIAIPTSLAYNYFVKRVEWFVSEMQLTAMDFIELKNSRKRDEN